MEQSIVNWLRGKSASKGCAHWFWSTPQEMQHIKRWTESCASWNRVSRLCHGALQRPRAAHINSAAHSKEFSISKAEQQHLHGGSEPLDPIKGHYSVRGLRRLFLGHSQTNQAHQRQNRINEYWNRVSRSFQGALNVRWLCTLFLQHTQKDSAYRVLNMNPLHDGPESRNLNKRRCSVTGLRRSFLTMLKQIKHIKS